MPFRDNLERLIILFAQHFAQIRPLLIPGMEPHNLLKKPCGNCE